MISTKFSLNLTESVSVEHLFAFVSESSRSTVPNEAGRSFIVSIMMPSKLSRVIMVAGGSAVACAGMDGQNCGFGGC